MSNLHANLDEANKHTPKGFDNAVDNTRPWRDERSESTYTENMELPKAINFVDGTAAAPTNADDDIYVIIGSGVLDASWGTLATFGDWVRAKSSAFKPITPVQGYRCYDNTAGVWMEFDGSVWAVSGGGATNLGVANITATNLDVTSDTGTDATLPSATGSLAGVMVATDKVKVDFITVTQAVDLDTMESDIATNNGKVSNVTTNLSIGTTTGSTLDIDSSDGTNATVPSFTSTDAGLAPGSGGGTTNFLRADGTWAAAGADGNGIYDGSGALSANPTTVTMGSNTLTYVSNTNTLFRYENTLNTGIISHAMYNDTGSMGGMSTFGSAYAIVDVRDKIAFLGGADSKGVLIGNAATTLANQTIKWKFGTGLSDSDVYMRLNPNGLVIGGGIGALSPSARLHSRGSANTAASENFRTESLDGNKFFEVNNAGHVLHQSDSGSLGTYYRMRNTSASGWSYLEFKDESDVLRGQLKWYNLNSGFTGRHIGLVASAGTLGMYFNVPLTTHYKWTLGSQSDGNTHMRLTTTGLTLGLGVGAATTDARLDVRGASGVGGAFVARFKNSSNVDMFKFENNGQFDFRHNDALTSTFHYIGNTNPLSSTLTNFSNDGGIVGSIITAGSTHSETFLRDAFTISGSGSAGTKMIFKDGTGGGMYFATSGTANDNETDMKLTSAGLLVGEGIGASTPTARLDVAGSNTARSGFRLRSGTAPTTPNDGDMWFDGTNFNVRIAGVTRTINVT